ncbi:hypothetical protein [Anaerolentibacter hominis]|uniref:hypothetical protein n=1 Tax=Anaerolentibacter hominis TaxID=3079009 RepID=UPI0031B80E6D
MKRYIPMLFLFIVCFLLTGCARQSDRRTQAISDQAENDKSTQQTTGDKEGGELTDAGDSAEGDQSPDMNPADAGELNLNELMDQYYLAAAEKEAVEIQIEKVEQQYRMGKLSQEEFNERYQELEIRYQELDQSKKDLKGKIKELGWDHEIPLEAKDLPALPESKSQLIRLMEEYDRQEDELEEEIDRLENAYYNGDIELEDFKEQTAELEKQADLADYCKDEIEDKLEALGWDD